MVKFDIDYDKEGDDLFLYSDKKSKGSIELGGLTLDFDSQGGLVGIEFIKAKELLAEFIDQEVSEEFLSSVKKCEVSTKQRDNFLFIKLTLVGTLKEISCQINAPLVMEKSPALAYN